ncbi:BQ2448_523 [Microbotryum intermedium]|uniref:BQ2448_523 protein n=1 Tax=Microbotryum intermedium TaxID=269621 RepID=A0A238F2N9_9BASI|nr:BQ2448_523 [Microbotryum intermedium]
MTHVERQKQLSETIDKAIQVRLQGNDKLKAGDLQGALQDYYSVLFSLRGLDGSIQEAMGAAPRLGCPSQSGTEPPLDDDVKAQRELTDKVKQAIVSTHINMAMIHSKKANWKRSLDCALEARKLSLSCKRADEYSLNRDNPKAKFREAQARIKLGEVTTGKKMIEDLHKASPDPAFVKALDELKLEEKARSEKNDQQFRGMFSKSKDKGKQAEK